MKKITAIVLTFILCFGVLSVAFAADSEAPVAEIPEGYTTIYTAEDLNNIRNNLSGKYILMNDIDLSEHENWEPIGNDSNPFAGIFDGNLFTVKNLKITNAEGENPSVGLFGTMRNSQIKNVTVVGIINVHNDNGIRAGLICGKAYCSAILSCIASGKINVSTNAGVWVGGIAGLLSEFSEDSNTKKECIIRQSRNNATVIANGTSDSDSYSNGFMLGGIAGISSGTITECSNYGNVSAFSQNGNYYYTLAGGVCGNSSGEISNCYNVGNINSVGSEYVFSARIVGSWTQYQDICNCYNIGELKAKTQNSKNEYSGTYIGGIIGVAESPVFPAVVDDSNDEYKAGIYNCYYINSVENAFGDGTCINQQNIKSLTKEEMASQASFVGFDFENVWEIDNEKGYPVLRTYIEGSELTTEPITEPSEDCWFIRLITDIISFFRSVFDNILNLVR